MPSCAVATCKSNYRRRLSAKGTPVTFHRFPRNDLAKIWLAACRRKDPVNVKSAILCSEHFTTDDYETSLRSEKLGTDPRPLLKPTALPTLNLPGGRNLQGADTSKRKLNDERQRRLTNRKKKTVISPPVEDQLEDNAPRDDEPEVIHKPVTESTRNVIIKIKSAKSQRSSPTTGSSSVDKKKATCFVCCNTSSSTSKLVQAEKVANFVIRKVFKINQDSIKDDLLTLAELRNWWAPCASCHSLIVQCFQLHNQLIETRRRFETSRVELLRKYRIHHRNKTALTSQGGVGTETSDEVMEEEIQVKSEVESDDEGQLANDNDPLAEEDNVDTNRIRTPGTVGDNTLREPVAELTDVKSEVDPWRMKPPAVVNQLGTSFADVIAKVPEIRERNHPKLTDVTPETVTDSPVIAAIPKLTRDPVTHRYNCPLCPFTNVRRCSVALHYEGIHFGFKCPEPCCTKSFRRRENYKSHLDQHHGTPRYSCNQCDLKFYYFNKLHSHRQRVHEGGLEKRHFVCELCGKGFPSGDNLTCHRFNSHNKRPKNLIANKPQRKLALKPKGPSKPKKEEYLGKFKCDRCPSRFRDQIDFSYHLYYRHKQGTEQAKTDYHQKYKFKCDVKGCTCKYTKQQQLEKHLKIFHGGNKDKPPEHLCRHCGKAFFIRGKMIQHELIHENKESRPFKCHLCGNGFPVWGYLHYHLKHVHKLDRESIQAVAPPPGPRSRSTGEESTELYSVVKAEETNVHSTHHK